MATIPIDYLVSDAAVKIGDPSRTRVRNEQWLLFVNQALREFTEKLNVLRFTATFALVQGATEYLYPDELTQMVSIEATETPSDPTTYAFLGQKFRDEFRSDVTGAYPQGSIPDRYHATTNSFFLIPACDTTINAGARLVYYGIADRVFTLEADFPLPWMSQDYIVRRMTIHAMRARNRHAEANEELKEWKDDMQLLEDKYQVRTVDRADSIAPRRNRLWGMR